MSENKEYQQQIQDQQTFKLSEHGTVFLNQLIRMERLRMEKTSPSSWEFLLKRANYSRRLDLMQTDKLTMEQINEMISQKLGI